ncbi:hypothetical protein FSK04_023550, partial [Escherichia coli]|nr:hypothetical protein [Escherichia coli]
MITDVWKYRGKSRQVVELVRQSGRETLRQLETKTGATRYLMSVLARELVASGDVYNSGYGLF